MSPESKAIVDILIKVMKFAISQFEILLRDEKKVVAPRQNRDSLG